MNLGAALREAALKQTDRLEALKRNPKTRRAALRLEQHAYGHVSNTKSKGGKR